MLMLIVSLCLLLAMLQIFHGFTITDGGETGPRDNHHYFATDGDRSACIPYAAPAQFQLAVNQSEEFDLPDFLRGPGIRHYRKHGLVLQDGAAAVCHWYENSGTNHFPHEMEQLYRCWSWWNAHRQQQQQPSFIQQQEERVARTLPRRQCGKIAVVAQRTAIVVSLEPPGHQGILPLVSALQAAFDVRLVDNTQEDDPAVLATAVRKGDQTVFGGYGYRMRRPEDAHELRAGILNALRIRETAGCVLRRRAWEF